MAKIREEVLREEFKKGNCKPLINLYITRKWIKKEDFSYDDFLKELEEISSDVTKTFKFNEQLLECLENAVETQKYQEYSGKYMANPYKMPTSKISFE